MTTEMLEVFPTCVGMVRTFTFSTAGAVRFPHVRGDGPTRERVNARHFLFSPRAWGWSEVLNVSDYRAWVFPTCVGMVRSGKRNATACQCFPHVRGDGPDEPW